MNKQRKVLITITYNEMGIIIDTKAEEVPQQNLQPTCNQLANNSPKLDSKFGELISNKRTDKRTETHGVCLDVIDRQAAIGRAVELPLFGKMVKVVAVSELEALPPAQPEAKPIDYRDCADAMLMMWMWNVLTDGEYYRIMDKLNKHEAERREG